jgi:hypothetical protein
MKQGRLNGKRCLVCDSPLRDAPTRRWWLDKDGTHGICYDCILHLAKHVLWAMEHECKPNVTNLPERKR